MRRRAILHFSDHLVIDVEEAVERVQLGDEVGFIPSYGSLLAASNSTSMYRMVRKR